MRSNLEKLDDICLDCLENIEEEHHECEYCIIVDLKRICREKINKSNKRKKNNA